MTRLIFTEDGVRRALKGLHSSDRVWNITDGDGEARGTIRSEVENTHRPVHNRPGAWRRTTVVASYHIELEERVSGYPTSWRVKGFKGLEWDGRCRRFEVVPGELYHAGTTTSPRATSAFASIRRTLQEVIGS